MSDESVSYLFFVGLLSLLIGAIVDNIVTNPLSVRTRLRNKGKECVQGTKEMAVMTF